MVSITVSKILSLLGLPSEIRLRVLRNLLVHDGPLTASRKSGRCSRCHTSDIDWITEDCVCYRAFQHQWLQVKLHRNILLVNRQLYHEGSSVLYNENSLSIQIDAYSEHPHYDGDIAISVFEHQEDGGVVIAGLEIARLSLPSETLLRFPHLHFYMKLELGCYKSRVRSYLMCLVTWLNEKYEQSQPRAITIDYDYNVYKRNSSVRRYRPDVGKCNGCGADFDSCQCGEVTAMRTEAQADCLTMLEPLQCLRRVRDACIIGVSAEDAMILAAAMRVPDEQRAPDLYPQFAALMRYLNKLPDDEDVQLVATVYNADNFRYPATQKACSDPLLARLTQFEDEEDAEEPAYSEHSLPLDIPLFCPIWLEKEAKLLKKAMYRHDLEVFVNIRSHIIDRVNAVMKILQDRMVFGDTSGADREQLIRRGPRPFSL